MPLSKKDFIAVAEIIRNRQIVDSGKSYFLMASNLADYFQSENSLFDREKFLNACGFKDEVI